MSAEGLSFETFPPATWPHGIAVWAGFLCSPPVYTSSGLGPGHHRLSLLLAPVAVPPRGARGLVLEYFFLGWPLPPPKVCAPRTPHRSVRVVCGACVRSHRRVRVIAWGPSMAAPRCPCGLGPQGFLLCSRRGVREFTVKACPQQPQRPQLGAEGRRDSIPPKSVLTPRRPREHWYPP